MFCHPLGGFLGDAGWFADAARVYKACLRVCRSDQTLSSLCKTLECCVRYEIIFIFLGHQGS